METIIFNPSKSQKKSEMIWTLEKTLDLIELYRERSLLWDPKHLRYREKLVRRKAYDEISTILQVQVDDCERKIHSLRTQFQREFKRKGKKSAWFAYEQLKFLLIGPRSGHMIEAIYDDHNSNIEDERLNNAEGRKICMKIERFNQQSQSETIIEPLNAESMSGGMLVMAEEYRPQVAVYRSTKRDPLDTPTTTSPPQPKIQRVEYIANNENTVTTMEVRHNSTELTPIRESSAHVSSPDSFDLFGKYIAEELRSVRDDVYSTQVAKHRINQILFQATTGAFRRRKSVDDNDH